MKGARGFYQARAKHWIDFLIAGAGLLLLSPVIVLVAGSIFIVSGPPVLFRQERPGLNGVSFLLYKFRTMSEAGDASGNLLPDDRRLTALGRLLRATSLDEIPTFINVLRGDMSLVGPRPLLMRYLERYTPWQSRRHEVRPGITGWAIVHGRNALTWEEKFDLDVWYVDNLSLWTDLSIVFSTIFVILSRKGISSSKHATMPEFMGSEKT